MRGRGRGLRGGCRVAAFPLVPTTGRYLVQVPGCVSWRDRFAPWMAQSEPPWRGSRRVPPTHPPRRPRRGRPTQAPAPRSGIGIAPGPSCSAFAIRARKTAPTIAPARCNGYHQRLSGLSIRILSRDVNGPATGFQERQPVPRPPSPPGRLGSQERTPRVCLLPESSMTGVVPDKGPSGPFVVSGACPVEPGQRDWPPRISFNEQGRL